MLTTIEMKLCDITNKYEMKMQKLQEEDLKFMFTDTTENIPFVPITDSTRQF